MFSFLSVSFFFCFVPWCSALFGDGTRQIGYPVLIRAAYALGGLGSGFAEDEEEFRMQAEKGFAYSDQLIIDQVCSSTHSKRVFGF